MRLLPIKIVLTELTTLTCDGIHVSSVYGCVKDGVLCNDVGTCVDQACVCNSGWTGEFCQEVVSSSSGSSDLALPIALGTHARTLHKTQAGIYLS